MQGDNSKGTCIEWDQGGFLDHKGRNQICIFISLLIWTPPGTPGVSKDPLNLDLEVWCPHIEPKLNELQKTLRSYQK